jgi:hypothetical protein
MFISLNPYLSNLCSIYSQKAIRHLQNQRAYQRRKTVIHASLRIPRLPARLIAATESPLPTSPLFRQAALSADALETQITMDAHHTNNLPNLCLPYPTLIV